MSYEMKIVVPCRAFDGYVNYWECSRYLTANTVIDIPVPSDAVKVRIKNPWSGHFHIDGITGAYSLCFHGIISFCDAQGYVLKEEPVNLIDPDTSQDIDIPEGTKTCTIRIIDCKPTVKGVEPHSPGYYGRGYDRIVDVTDVMIIQFFDKYENLVEEYHINGRIVFFGILPTKVTMKIPGVYVVSPSFEETGPYMKYLGLLIYKAYNVKIHMRVYDAKSRFIAGKYLEIPDVYTNVESWFISDDDLAQKINPDTEQPYMWKDVKKIELEFEVLDKSKTAMANVEFIFMTKWA